MHARHTWCHGVCACVHIYVCTCAHVCVHVCACVRGCVCGYFPAKFILGEIECIFRSRLEGRATHDTLESLLNRVEWVCVCCVLLLLLLLLCWIWKKGRGGDRLLCRIRDPLQS